MKGAAHLSTTSSITVPTRSVAIATEIRRTFFGTSRKIGDRPRRLLSKSRSDPALHRGRRIDRTVQECDDATHVAWRGSSGQIRDLARTILTNTEKIGNLGNRCHVEIRTGS